MQSIGPRTESLKQTLLRSRIRGEVICRPAQWCRQSLFSRPGTDDYLRADVAKVRGITTDTDLITSIRGFNRGEQTIGQKTSVGHFAFSSLKDPYYKIAFCHRARCEHLGTNSKKAARQEMYWQANAKSPAFEQKSRREPNDVGRKQHPGISSPE